MPQLAFRRTGTPSDMPLVLLHALPLDSTMWDGVRELLLDLDIITPDAPGFGASPCANDFGDPSLVAYADAVKDLLDSLEVTHIVLGGLSMGGTMAAEFVSRYPSMVAGLALMDTNISADTEEGMTKRHATAAKADSGLGFEAVCDWPMTMLSSHASDSLRATIRTKLEGLPNEGLAWQQRAMAARPDRADAVSLVDGPVFFGRGDEDPTCSLEYLMTLALKAQTPRIVEFSPSSHFSASEQPAQVAQFLTELYAAA